MNPEISRKERKDRKERKGQQKETKKAKELLGIAPLHSLRYLL